MLSIAKVASFAVAGLRQVGTAAAAPVHNATALVARGPYDTHNGWVQDVSEMFSLYRPRGQDSEWVAAVGTARSQEMVPGTFYRKIYQILE
ncbi:hypothetical protein FRC10_008396 [Ceratobasidium sp. 414]|nr:hypothetical protein FRC10_008396 [Ceratobasidium sp. 414]